MDPYGVEGLELLEADSGFPLDLRAPRTDKLALEAANHEFGTHVVDQVMKTYHRAKVSSEALRTDLQGYHRLFAGPGVRKETAYQLALQSVRDQFTPSQLIVPLTLGAVEKHPNLVKGTSPGLPYRKLKNEATGDYFKTKLEVLEAGRSSFWHRKWDLIGRGRSISLPDCCQYYQAQTCDVDTNKIRTVWGYPLDVIIEEGRWFFPYMDWVNEHSADIPVAYGKEMATGGMAYVDLMFRSFRRGNALMTEWSSFDKTIPPWLIRDCFQIIYESMDMEHVECSEGYKWPVGKSQSAMRFQRMVDYFINTPIRTHTGERFRKKGGVPSGSMFTNLIDTIINCVITRYLMLETTGFLPDANLYLGDDAVVITESSVDIDHVARLAREKFGMVLNRKKTSLTSRAENIQFLGYFNDNGKPERSQVHLISSFIHPERMVSEPMITVMRALGEMYATMNPWKALPWYKMLLWLMDNHRITLEELDESVAKRGGRFYIFLKTYGFNPMSITVPQ